jgi:ribonucleoside-diphosphate reductase alpha chain
VDELKAIFDPRGGQWMSGRYVPSLLAAIGEVIERHMVDIGFLGQRGPSLAPEAHVPVEGARARFCPRCGDASFIKLEGCES